jgi:hypothetical protein
MRTLVIPLLAAALFALPAGARADDLALTDLRISVGWSAGPSRQAPARVVHVDRRERDRDDGWRHRRQERRHDRRHDRHRYHDDERIVVIDRDRPHRHCDDGRVVIVRPGTRVIIADGRRW